MGTYPPTQPDPLTKRIENLEASLQRVKDLEISLEQIIKIFEAPSEGLNIRGLYMTKERQLKIIFEKEK